MNKSPTTRKRPRRIPFQVQLDPEVARMARLHRVESGENVSDFVNRLIVKALEQQTPKPAA